MKINSGSNSAECAVKAAAFEIHINRAPSAPCGLLTNQSEYPMNIEGAPLFDWWVCDSDYDEVQSAYQIRLYDGITGDIVWDSQKVSSSEQSSVEYSGAPLKHGYPYSWEVRTWDRSGEVSPYSERARFATGLNNEDWCADWIQGVNKRPSPLTLVEEKDGASTKYWAESAGCGITLLNQGFKWTDYTLSLDVKVVKETAGIIFRAIDDVNSGYKWYFTSAGEFFIFEGVTSHYRKLACIENVGVKLGESFHLEIKVIGNDITTYIDGVEIDRRTCSSNPEGTVGFYTKAEGAAQFANVVVTAPDGKLLFADDFKCGVENFGSYGPLVEDNTYWYSRKVANLAPKEVKYALAYVCGSQDYELYINGTRIGRAQTFDYLGENKYQGWDITDAVRGSDVMTVGILNSYFGGGQGRAIFSKAGLLARFIVYYADGTSDSVITDGSWVTHSTGYYNREPRNSEGDEVEYCDARLMLDGWAGPDYDTADWMPVIVHGAHPTRTFYNLQPEVGHVAEKLVSAVSVTRLEDGTTVADFGKVIPASVIIHFPNGVAGTEITVQEGYELNEDGTINTTIQSTQHTKMTYVYTMKGGPETFTAWGFLGFRYVSVPKEAGELKAEDFEATIFHAELVSGRKSTLTTSNEMLNKVFDLMQRSALYSVQNQFVDTPTREKGQFLVDAINSSASTTSGSYERQMTRKAILQFLDSADRHWSDEKGLGMYNAVYPNVEGCRGIPDFSLNLPVMVWRYYMLTKDKTLIERAYPYMRNTADFVTRSINPDTGLVTAIYGGGEHRSYSQGIVDSPIGRFGYDWKGTVNGARTTINSLGVRVYDKVVEMAKVLGYSADAEFYSEKAAALRASMNKRLINEQGIFCDGLTADGVQSQNMSQHATSHTIMANVADREKWGAMAEYAASLGMKQGPMTVDILMEALFKAGRGDAAVHILTNVDDYSFGKLINDGYTYTWENWQAGSQSHGWGAASLWQIIEYISGVMIVEPGASKIRIAPLLGSVDEATSRTYTARGAVDITYSGSGRDYAITVDIPANMTADILFPLVSGGSFVETRGMNGVTAFTEDAQVVTVGSGKRSFKFLSSGK